LNGDILTRAPLTCVSSFQTIEKISTNGHARRIKTIYK